MQYPIVFDPVAPSTAPTIPDESPQAPRPDSDPPLAAGQRQKKRRGFAAMSPEKHRKIASLGGKAAHAKGTGHEFTTEEARAAGRKGGAAAQAKHALAKRGD